MKVLITVAAILVLGFGLGLIFFSPGESGTAPTGSNEQKYTCPMHPDIISDKPGKCPKCNMELVQVEVESTKPMQKDKPMHEHEMQGTEEESKTEMMMTTAGHNIYTCPMPEHYSVLQYGPGKCPKCGMALVPVEKTDNREVYFCPMPQDSIVQNKPGKCPKCGMELVKLDMKTSKTMPMEGTSKDQKMDKTEMMMKNAAHNIYTCPMPQDYSVLQYGPGKCPKCGMALIPVEKTENKEVYFCPMPQDSVVQNKPGKCPKCGMELVKLDMKTSKTMPTEDTSHEQKMHKTEMKSDTD